MAKLLAPSSITCSLHVRKWLQVEYTERASCPHEMKHIIANMLPLWMPWLLVLCPTVAAQFGGYTPPAPVCKAFQCPSGQQPVGREEVEIVSYGCKEAGLNVLSMKDFEPSNPYAGMNQLGKNLNKCCLERDICKQTCGMTAKECHDSYQKCQQKVCKGDQNCQLQAMVADFTGDPYDENQFDSENKDKFDPLESWCSKESGVVHSCD